MFIGEDPAVDEIFHLINVYFKASEGVYSGIFPVAYDAQVEVVRGDAVAACPHRFFARKIDDGIEFVRYAYFHV